jgi:class 3 adenylate cyclase
VDSTGLASQLDPEDYRDVVRAYQAMCGQVIHRFDGYIAQYLGDGVLVYFGYPQAHEDDAERAVRTGLGIVEAMGALLPPLKSDPRSRLAVRLGIHTGLVVIGEIGEGTSQEQLALGETPNIAARLQGLAAPNTVVISEATARLVAGVFTWQALAAEDLKGLPQPLRVYRVLHAHATQTRLDMGATRGLSPLVGREAEVTVLLDRWAQVQAGRGQGIVLSGEAGIGKSRLVQVLKEHVASVPHTRWECHGSPYYQHTALYPLIEFFPRALQWHPEETPEEKGEKLTQIVRHTRLPVEESVPLLASLLALPLPEGQYPPLALSPQRQRQKTLEAIVTLLVELAARQPVLFILEDVHWTDPTTQELLALLLDHTATAAVCTLLTTRPVLPPPWRPRPSLTQVTLSPLSPPQVAQLAEQVARGKPLPVAVVQLMIARTDGIPLFVEELTKALLESGILHETEDRYELTGPLPAFAIPTTLQDALMARLDRLVTAKGVAQLGATIGRHFSYALLRAVAPVEEAILSTELRRLVEAGILSQRGVLPQATYTFTHALIQETAYQSLLKSTRQQYHRRIAQVLEAHWPDPRNTQPELLAYHYTEAGFIAQAIPYWQRAGQHAMQRSALVEAVNHLTKGLELLRTFLDTPERVQQELVLQTTLGPALIATKGYAAPEVEQAYARARVLCRQAGETPQLIPVLFGLRLYYQQRAAFQTARELEGQLFHLAQRAHAPAFLLMAHQALGIGFGLSCCSRQSIFRLPMIFGQRWAKPRYGKNSILLQSLTASPDDIELTWRHLFLVPRPIAPQLDAAVVVNLVDKPQRARRSHGQTQGVGPDNTLNLAALILPQAVKAITVANGNFYGPAVAVVCQDGLWSQGEVGGKKGFNPRPWLSLASLFGALGGRSLDHHDAQQSTRQHRMPKALPGLHLGTGFGWVGLPAQALAGQGSG